MVNLIQPGVGARRSFPFSPSPVITSYSIHYTKLYELGLIFTLNGTLWNLFVGWSAARIAGRMSRGGALSAWFNRGVGAIFLYLGCRLALAEQS